MQKFFITCIVIAIIFLLMYAIWVVYSRITANRIMRESRNKKNFTYNYLSMRFSRLNTMKNVRLLIKDRFTGAERAAKIGTVFVNRGGIFVIETVYGSGFIEVEEGGKWSRFINDKQYAFDDPLKVNSKRAKAMKDFLKSQDVDNIPVHNVVVFTGKRIDFSKKINGLVTAPELPGYLTDANMDRYLNRLEIRKVVKLIKSKQLQ